MTAWEMTLTIGAVVLGTMATRFISFIVFAKSEKPPAIITYLGDMLPAAVMGLLVVYSLRMFHLRNRRTVYLRLLL